MACYIVAIETSKEETRKNINNKLRNYDGFCPITKYCWAITTKDKKAKDIRDDVSKVSDSNDRIFVIKSGTEAAWKNSYSEKHTAWLKKNL